MNDKHFIDFILKLDKYINIPKEYVENVPRMHEIEEAYNIATDLFSNMYIELKEDALKLGGLALYIKGFDIVIRGKKEIELFSKLISYADNFEIYVTERESIAFSLMFNSAYIIK